MSTTSQTPKQPGQRASTERSRSFFRGWMIPAGIVLVGVLELAILIWIGVATSFWYAILAVVLGWIVGFALLVAAGQQSITRMISIARSLAGTGDMKRHMSRPAFTLLAAMCFFFPGLLTDLAGLILLVTPVQQSVIKQSGLTGSGRSVLYSRRGGGVIEGEVVIDTTRQDTSSGHQGDPTHGPGQHSTPPRVLEGDVVGEENSGDWGPDEVR